MNKPELNPKLVDAFSSLELSPISRRHFLVCSGILGILAATPNAWAEDSAEPDMETVDWAQVLRDVSLDTLNGLAAFAVPGQDSFSSRQRLKVPGAGGVDNGAGIFMSVALDIFSPFNTDLSVFLMVALANVRDEVVAGFFRRKDSWGAHNYHYQKHELEQIDDAFFNWLRSSKPKPGLPLTIITATLLNIVSAKINPHSVNNTFYKGFGSLHWKDKARVFKVLETHPEALAAHIWGDTDSPVGQLVLGIMRFLPGSLLEFVCWGSFVEPLPLVDFDNLTLLARPPGWDYAGYQVDGSGPRLDPVDGWDDFIGYFRNRTEVSNA